MCGASGKVVRLSDLISSQITPFGSSRHLDFSLKQVDKILVLNPDFGTWRLEIKNHGSWRSVGYTCQPNISELPAHANLPRIFARPEIEATVITP